MSLAPGHRLGPYEVIAAIGAGGMGEVYRATDSRLKRDVAIKVLPASMSADPDRLARFQREAEVLAALNHPQIASIYGLEEVDSTPALGPSVPSSWSSSRGRRWPIGSRKGRFRWTKRWRSRDKSPMRSRRPTSAASSTAI